MRRLSRPITIILALLFVGGCAIGWYWVIPHVHIIFNQVQYEGDGK